MGIETRVGLDIAVKARERRGLQVDVAGYNKGDCVNGISISAVNNIDCVKGVKIGLGNISTDSAKVYGIEAGFFGESHRFYGVRAHCLHGFSDEDGGKGYGLEIGCLSLNQNGYVNGIRINLLNNGGCDRGLRLGFINAKDSYSNSEIYGVEIGVSNITTFQKGVQIGVGNTTEEVDGLQVGLWNHVLTRLRGLQVGLVCYAKEGTYVQVGLLTFRGNRPWYKSFSPLFGFGMGKQIREEEAIEKHLGVTEIEVAPVKKTSKKKSKRKAIKKKTKKR
jgi:hypothetical protein